MTVQIEIVNAVDTLRENVRILAQELPGITFGYIGNTGVDRFGPYDDRSWRIFLPHPGVIGQSFLDDVHLGATEKLPQRVEEWNTLAAQARRLYTSYLPRRK